MQTSFRKVDVKRLIADEVSKIRPCYLNRGVELEERIQKSLQTRTVESDLRAMISELLFGVLEKTLEEKNPDARKATFAADLSEDGKDITVSIRFPGPPVPTQLLESLRRGKSLSEQVRADWKGLLFLWGLSPNTGIRLFVERQKDLNIVSLRVPVIEHE